MGEKQWEVLIHRRAEKRLKRLHGSILARIREAINALAFDAHPNGSKKLIGHENFYRIRVGDWRIIYAIEDDKLIILVLDVAPRGGIYKNY